MLHANLLHLLGNMVFLAAVGAAVELATGSFRFVIVYFASGLAGVGLHFMFTRDVIDPAPLIGASGCIAGCAAYYNVRYTKLKVALAPHLSMSVLAVTLMWLALQIAGAFVKIGDTRGVAFYAHLGGFAAGIALSAVFRAPDFAQLELKHEALARMNDRGPDVLIAGAKAHLEEHPEDVEALHHLADAYRTLGDSNDERDVIIRLIAIQPDAECLDRLADLRGLSRLPVARRSQIVELLKADHPDVATRILESILHDTTATPQHPDAMLALAALERERHPEKADTLLAELARQYPLHPAVDVARKRGWIA